MAKTPRTCEAYKLIGEVDPTTLVRHDTSSTGTFLLSIPAKATVGDLCEFLTNELPFDEFEDLVVGEQRRATPASTPLAKLNLQTGDVLVARGLLWLRLTLDEIISGPPMPVLNPMGFNSELLAEYLAEALGSDENEPESEDLGAIFDRPPVSRVIGSVEFRTLSTGNCVKSEPTWRAEEGVKLGMLAVAATDGGPLALADSVLVVGTPGQQPSRVFRGCDFAAWTNFSLADLDVPPGPVAETAGETVCGVEVKVLPDPNSAGARDVTGQARFLVVGNGDYWRLQDNGVRWLTKDD